MRTLQCILALAKAARTQHWRPRRWQDELVLHGRFHPSAGDDHEGVARALHDRLRAIALEALGPVLAEVLVRVLSLRRWIAFARRALDTEVELTVVASLARLERQWTPAEARPRIAAIEASLMAMGLPRW